MFTARHRPILYASAGVLLVWLLAWGGYYISSHSRVTAEKVAAYLHSVDLSRLSGDARAKALRDLARKMNALQVEERRRARLDEEWARWFQEMTEEEKAAFIEATMPSGFKQMLASFEQLPEDKRKKAISDSMKEMKKLREAMESQEPGLAQTRTNRQPELSPELQQKVVQIGLKSFYSESSAQTKAELAPLLEEMQRQMENGRLFRGGEGRR